MESNCSLYKKFLDLCREIYRPEGKSIELTRIKKDIDRIFDFARRNRLDHCLALKYNHLFKEDKKWNDMCNMLISEYNNYKNNLKNAIRKVKEILDRKPFIVIKTFSTYPHLTSDLDILVKDLETVEESNGKIANEKDLFPVDINAKISWGEADAVSNDFAWNNIQRFTFEGIDFLVPNPMLDTIIRIAHMPFETAHIKLGELLHIYKQASLFDWTVLENEAKFMGWPKTFKRMSNILEMLHYKLFETSFFKKDITPILYANSIEFPFRLPISILSRGVVEKKAWKKIFGARYIIKDWIAEWIHKNTS